MPTDVREVSEGRQHQGVKESIAYKLDTSPQNPPDPASTDAKCYDITTGGYDDVTATLLSGSSSISGNFVVSPQVLNGILYHLYRLEFKWTKGGNTFWHFAEVMFDR